MAKPTKEQLKFFYDYDIPLSKVYDATGLSTHRWRQDMHELEMLVAIGVSGCKKGHTTRTQGGHCAQCKPANLAFVKRYYDENYIYIAVSKKNNLLKIGVTKDVIDRNLSLNKTGYGGIRDWRIKHSYHCNHSGRVENIVHTMLSKYSVPKSYIKEGIRVNCQEIFSCDENEAVTVVNNTIKDYD